MTDLCEVTDPLDHEHDPEFDGGQRLAIGRLGAEVKGRWGCTGCRQVGADVYVERYDEKGHGSTFALCTACLYDWLDPRERES